MHSFWSMYQGPTRNLCSDKCKCLHKSDYFFFCPSAIQGPRPVCGGLAASQTGRYAGKRVWEYAGIRWMANDEGTRMKIGWVLEECRALLLSREAWQRLRQVGKSL